LTFGGEDGGMQVERVWLIPRGDLRGASAARRDFTSYLRGKADEPGRDDAALIFGEMVANAVKSARSSVIVELLLARSATLRVVDDGDCFERSRISPQPLFAEHGRGLYIADTLAGGLNIAGSDEHCEVTAVLPISL
jgi:hypothetical protein